MDELLALLGQHWRLLLLYPGGLTAIVALALWGGLIEGRRWLAVFRIPPGATIPLAAGWLLAIALLPLPQTGWPYGLDALTLLLLIEIPYWAHTIRRGQLSMARMAALLNSYPLLTIGIAAVGQGSGSLVVREINRSTSLLHWVGVGAWALTMPPLLGLGPWRDADRPALVETLRQLTHMALLLAITLPAHDATPRLNTFLGFLAMALPLAALQRWWRGDGNRWLRWQPWLVITAIAVITILSAQQLLGGMR